jgi:hypothetical protein
MSDHIQSCDPRNYQITKFQVGKGGAATAGVEGAEDPFTVSLGKPLTKEEYGTGQVSITTTSGGLYSEQGLMLDTQEFGNITMKSQVLSSLVHVWSLDEETANGQIIDEAGLFVENPYLEEPPGHMLAAYKKFTPIRKENYFTLLFRWKISFPIDP